MMTDTFNEQGPLMADVTDDDISRRSPAPSGGRVLEFAADTTPLAFKVKESARAAGVDGEEALSPSQASAVLCFKCCTKGCGVEIRVPVHRLKDHDSFHCDVCQRVTPVPRNIEILTGAIVLASTVRALNDALLACAASARLELFDGRIVITGDAPARVTRTT